MISFNFIQSSINSSYKHLPEFTNFEKNYLDSEGKPIKII